MDCSRDDGDAFLYFNGNGLGSIIADRINKGSFQNESGREARVLHKNSVR